MRFNYMLLKKKENFKEAFSKIFSEMFGTMAKLCIPILLLVGMLWFMADVLKIADSVLKVIGIILFLVWILYVKVFHAKEKRKMRVSGIIQTTENYIKKEKYKQANELLDNTFIEKLTRAYKEPLKKDKDKQAKMNLYLRFLELRANLNFVYFLNNYNDSVKEDLIKILDKIIEISNTQDLKQNKAYAYANRAMVNIYTYENKKDKQDKLNAKNDYKKAIEDIEDNNIKNELRKQLNKIA